MPSDVDNLTESEDKCLKLILQIQELHQQGIGIAEISRRTGKDVGTIKKYLEGDPKILCRRKQRRGKSILDPCRDMILTKLREKVHQAEIIRQLYELGYNGTNSNAQIYIRNLCEEYDINASKYRSGGNSLGTKRTGNGKSMNNEYITRTGIFNHIWMNIELTEEHKEYLWEKYNILYELDSCVRSFRNIFETKNMSLLYLYIEKYVASSIKEIATFAKGLQKDIEAVENAVASDKSIGFVEGTNSRLKMVKRTMYGRCSHKLLAAKLIYNK